MSAEQPESDLARLLHVLDRYGVEYVMVGGFAAAFADLGARLVIAGMTDDGARLLPVVIDAATLRAFGSTPWATEAGPLDVPADLPVDGGRRGFDELSRRSGDVEFSGVAVIDGKSRADRPKDREVLPELLRLRDQHTYD